MGAFFAMRRRQMERCCARSGLIGATHTSGPHGRVVAVGGPACMMKFAKMDTGVSRSPCGPHLGGYCSRRRGPGDEPRRAHEAAASGRRQKPDAGDVTAISTALLPQWRRREPLKQTLRCRRTGRVAGSRQPAASARRRISIGPFEFEQRIPAAPQIGRRF